MVLPGLGPLLLPRLGRRYVRGLHPEGSWPIYTGRRHGAVPTYWHLNCPPEVTVLTLAPCPPADWGRNPRAGTR